MKNKTQTGTGKRNLWQRLRDAGRAFVESWRSGDQQLEVVRIIGELARERELDETLVEVAAKLYRQLNTPEQSLKEVLQHERSGLLAFSEALQRLVDLVAHGAILNFHIKRRLGTVSPDQADPEQPEEVTVVGASETVDQEQTRSIALLRDRYRVPGKVAKAATVRRRAPRFASPQALDVQVRHQGQWLTAQACNLSASGVLLQSPMRLELRDRVRLRLQNQRSAEYVEVTGWVARRGQAEAARGGDIGVTAGIAFDRRLRYHPRAFLKFA